MDCSQGRERRSSRKRRNITYLLWKITLIINYIIVWRLHVTIPWYTCNCHGSKEIIKQTKEIDIVPLHLCRMTVTLCDTIHAEKNIYFPATSRALPNGDLSRAPKPRGWKPFWPPCFKIMTKAMWRDGRAQKSSQLPSPTKTLAGFATYGSE